MENTPNILDPLMEKVEEYGKSSLELIKLKVVEKIATFVAIVYANVILFTILILFVAFFNIGLSLWIGTLLGEIYLGFFTVAAFYGLAGLIYYLFGMDILINKMKKRISALLLS
jgi:hypothetical protein